MPVMQEKVTGRKTINPIVISFGEKVDSLFVGYPRIPVVLSSLQNTHGIKFYSAIPKMTSHDVRAFIQLVETYEGMVHHRRDPTSVIKIMAVRLNNICKK
jgi:hypothetical protein